MAARWPRRLVTTLRLSRGGTYGGWVSKTYLCRDINGDAHLVAAADLVQRTSVYVVVVQSDAVLLVRDSTGRAGLWDLPGGGVEPGEERLSALGRELFEETGLRLEGEPSHLCEFTEYFFDLQSRRGWESTRCYYAGAVSGSIQHDGNGADVSGCRYMPLPSSAGAVGAVARKMTQLALDSEGRHAIRSERHHD